MKKIVISSLLLITLLLVSCKSKNSVKLSNNKESYVEGEDFNPSAINWMWAPTVFAGTEDGVYFVAGEYIFHTDAVSKKTVPLCFRTDCLHNHETDAEKIPECDAFIGGGTPYIGTHKDNLILISLNKQTLQREIIMEKTDGSNRETLISDISRIDVPNIRMHRGVLFYFMTSLDMDGNQKITLNAFPLTKKRNEITLFSITEENIVASMILPAGNHVFFEIEKKDDTSRNSYTIYCLDLRGNKLEELTKDDQYRLYGYKRGRVILRSGGQYYEYSKEIGIREEDTGLNAFHEAHSSWNCHADCIDDDLTFFSCINRETRELETNLYVCNNEGKTLCEIEEEGWGYSGAQMIIMNGKKYYVRFSTSLDPFSVKAYLKEDLLNGKSDYITLLNVDSYNADLSPAYILPSH